MLILAAILIVLGAFIMTQNTQTKVGVPMLLIGIVLVVVMVFS